MPRDVSALVGVSTRMTIDELVGEDTNEGVRLDTRQ